MEIKKEPLFLIKIKTMAKNTEKTEIKELEQLELPNMPKPELNDSITIKYMKVGNKQFYAIDVESKNPEVYVVSQKLWALLQKLAKNNVSINLKID